ncbi:unnamed protein product [Rotaria sordida]|uniref:Uncharacterized protein n=1 Tax=Rotaria sordida TaxID=392033 RepID=A0A815HXB4_9BILA|nr:unnamed protein product [Rotaria sordida]CAF3926848.1 unnamed protein product [Rotaria sordida]
MAYLQRNQFGFEANSSPVTVPDNDVARLMYYFDCVCDAIEYDDSDLNRYRNYRNWSSLSYEERRVLLALCLTFSPDVFDNKVFFQSDALCGDRSNKFYKISQVSHQLLAVQSIVIAGRRRQVKQIMTYKMAWMQKNYFNPVQRLAQQYNRNTSQSPSCVIS